MQWTPDRNGGFSRADPAALTLPTIMDPLYGYESVNVEAQSRDPHSLLNWMRRMLAVRRQHRAFGRGTLRFLFPKNRKILAYLREYAGETILCVANLARSPQAVEIDLSEFAGWVPVELNNGSLFPPIGQLTYLLTLPPYGFYWFILAKEGEWPSWHTPAPEPMPEYQTFVLRGPLSVSFMKSSRSLFEREVLPPYLAKRRWFSAKHEALEQVRVVYLARLPEDERAILLCEIETRTKSGTARWLLPLAVMWEGEPALSLPGQLALARVRRDRRVGLLTDAFAVPDFAHRVVAALADGTRIALPSGEIRFEPLGEGAKALRLPGDAEVNWLTAEQSNSSLIIGDAVMLKMFRRISGGPHPEVEMGRYLTRHGFANSPALLGEMVRVDPDGTRSALAVAQGFVRNQGDAWTWLVDHLVQGLDDLAASAAPPASAGDHFADYDALAAIIGQRLGEMHAVLAQGADEPDFVPVPARAADVAQWAAQAREQLAAAIDLLVTHVWERGEDHARAVMLAQDQGALLGVVDDLARSGEGSLMCRVHGDFHLGQVLVASGDVYIIDFEGEPARPLAQRRAKTSPLRDVAGLLRSFDYAAATVMNRNAVGVSQLTDERRDAFAARFRAAATAAFMSAYRKAVAAAGGGVNERLLDLFMIEKAAYEVCYEAANRPTWMSVPLGGLATLATRLLGRNGDGHGDG
jgi:maltose alpha-D-glucosyltransferase / alpha-amylase